MSYLNLKLNTVSSLYLSPDQRAFLTRLLPWAQVIQNHIRVKADFMRIPSPAGIFASILAADILIVSNWGAHPLSQKRYNKKAANNLSLLQPNQLWDRKTIFYDGKEYCCYGDWDEYAKDVSDHYIYTDEYYNALTASDITAQAEFFSQYRERPAQHRSLMLSLISEYGLRRVDQCQVQESKLNPMPPRRRMTSGGSFKNNMASLLLPKS